MNRQTTLFATAFLGLAMTASAQNTFRSAANAAANAPTLTLFSNKYTLASYNQKYNPTWEFTSNEAINAWTSLVTLIDRADAKTVTDMDKLSEGLMSYYKKANAVVLAAKTLKNKAGVSFNYMLVAFDEPAKQRFELNFIKVGMGPKNAYIMLIGLRIRDPKDYKARTKEFLEKRSGEVGEALGEFVVADLSTLPRREF